MATPRELIEAAYGTSSKFQPNEIATEEVELLNVVKRVVRTMFEIADRVNPFFFAATDTIAQASGAYPRPSDARCVWRLEMPSGAPVNLVPFDDRLIAPGPSVYRFGGKYHPVQGIAVEDLTAFFSRRPADPADLDSAIDPSWPEEHDPVLIDEIGFYLAIKDGLEEEFAGRRAQRDGNLALFLAFLGRETIGEIRRLEPVRFEASNAVVPLSSLLAGGTGLTLGG